MRDIEIDISSKKYTKEIKNITNFGMLLKIMFIEKEKNFLSTNPPKSVFLESQLLGKKS